MKQFHVSTPLFDEAAADGSQSGGGNGAGTANSGAFDQTAFKAEVMADFNKTLNGFAKSFKADISKLMTPKAEAAAETNASAEASAAGKADPEKNALTLELKNLKAGFEAKFKALEDAKAASDRKADEAERDSQIRAELGKYSFAPGKASETAFQLVKSAATRAEDGSLVADDLPLAKWIENRLPADHSYLLAAKDVSSAGARPGKGAAGKKWSVADLNPATFAKRTPQEQSEIREYIRTMA